MFFIFTPYYSDNQAYKGQKITMQLLKSFNFKSAIKDHY